MAAALYASHFNKGGELARGPRGILKRQIYTSPRANPPSPPFYKVGNKCAALFALTCITTAA